MEILIDDLWSASPGKGKRKPRKHLSSEELDRLSIYLKNGEDILEPLQRAIVDAGQWMYEAAAVPEDGDIEDAMEKAAEAFKGNPEMNDDLWVRFFIRGR